MNGFCEIRPVELIQIYKCFCDASRLRILHLLTRGPLCVCHFQDILQMPQTRISQHLAYLRKWEMVEAKRSGTWMIYRLPAKASPELEKNLQCLQDCAATDPQFRADLKRLSKLAPDTEWVKESLSGKSTCC